MAAIEKVADHVIPQLPKKWLSHVVGVLAHKKPPRWVNQKLIRSFVKMYNIDTGEVEKPLREYKSLGEFYARRLKPSARIIEGDVVHPCDGQIIRSGRILDGTLIQAKGKTFQLDDFVPQNPWGEHFDEGTFANYYLAPNNYHRVHAPLSGEIQWVTVIPGELWPVNSWSVHRVDNLYAVNERVAIGIKTPKGFCIVVMVGATNVGSIRLAFDEDIETNSDKFSIPFHRTYPKGREIAVGEELGTFHLGSTTVVLYEKNFAMKPFVTGKVLMGGTPEFS